MSTRAKGWARIVAGFLLAPAVALLAFDIAQAIERGSVSAPSFLLFGSRLAYPIVLLFGVPVLAALYGLKWLRWWQVTLAGASFALIYLARHLLFHTLLADPQDNARVATMLGGIGAAIGFAFWVIAVRRNHMLVSFERVGERA